MKVIAKRGEYQFLLAERVGSEYGRVLDIRAKRLFPEERIAVIAKGGYWEEYSLPATELDRMLQEIEG